MRWQSECAAIIPCFNEQAAIASVLQEVRRHLTTVLVVDDGSSDRTAEVSEQTGAQVLRFPRNQGKGAALSAGWNWAVQRGFHWALSLDGDGQHSAEDIPSFFKKAEETGAPLIVGNRMGSIQEIPWLRRQVNCWMSRRLSRTAGQPLPDSQCGFRLMSLTAWSRLQINAAHFEIESDVLLAFIRVSHRIEFVPIRVNYRNERSKINPLWDTLRWFRWYFRARKARATGRPPN